MQRGVIAAVTILVFAAATMAAPVNVQDFSDQAVAAGTENEDWQPAFQAAIAQARQQMKPLYVPAGEYKIRQPIEIRPVEEPRNALDHNDLFIYGDGKYLSIISQQVETENCVNWTSETYENSATFGHMKDLCLSGGDVTLNIKWHNYFHMDTCYIQDAQSYGIHAEGWSSRFVNSTIRWCRKAGIYATGHFNNNVIRDCYFSRDGIGVRCVSGWHGSRIEGCGFESCAKAAVFVRGCRSLTISNSYFEGNGYAPDNSAWKYFDFQQPTNTIHLDYACRSVSIHDNIFRANLDEEGALISVTYCIGGHVYDNLFYNSKNGIKLRNISETNENAESTVVQFVVEDNLFSEVENPLLQTEPGLIEKALTRRSAFHISANNTCEGSPVGQLRPRVIGDEILDSASGVWYQASGPTKDDWVPLYAPAQ